LYPEFLGGSTYGKPGWPAYASVMVSAWAQIRARERIVALGAAGLGDRDLRRQVLAALHEMIDFDAYVWLLTDPVTAVGAAPLAEVPCLTELPALIKAKYATPVNRWTALLRQASPAGLLHDAVGGDLSRSRVWREVMSRYRIGDVASVVFADQYGCWGFLDLWRDDAREPFDRDDAALMVSLAAPLTSALRSCQARTFVEPSTPHRSDTGPVVLTLDDDLRITSRTAASQAWLEVLLPPEPDGRAIPASVYNVTAQLLAAEDGIDDHPAYARTHLAGGFWLTLRAARLSSDDRPDSAEDRGPTLVVTIEETSAADRLDLFGRSFALTAREHELLDLLAAGGDTRAMARQMSLSEHTIQDHLKSIFAKTGARDRVTVLSRALGTRREANTPAENSKVRGALGDSG
jgi:DNA-binding CsgD family transcriptional regulator